MDEDERRSAEALGLIIGDLPDYVREGIVRMDTDLGPVFMITDAALNWLMTDDNCANRELNAQLRGSAARMKGER